MTATAPKQGQPAPTITDRTAPAPWALCDVCGKRTALMHPGEQVGMCPGCARREVLRDAAEASLTALGAPVLGAWGRHWLRAGLRAENLYEVLERVTGAWMHDRAQREHLRDTLAHTMRAAPVPTVTHAPPARLALDLDALPMLEDVRPADHAQPWPYFVTGEGKKVDVYAGPDALTLTLPDGVRAVLYVGMGGQVEGGPVSGFRCPPHLWAAVTAALSGPYGVLPSLTGVDVAAGGLNLTLDLYGRSSRYSLTVGARYTAQAPATPGQPYRVTFPEVLDRGRGLFALALWVPADLWPAFRAALPGGTVRGPA